MPRTPETLVFVYDDECGFCTWVAEYAARRSDVDVVGFSELSAAQRDRLPADYDACAHLLVGDATYSCGRAIAETLARIYPGLAPLFSALRRVPYYPAAREAAYRWGANHRDLFGRVLSR
jgi:predicted DCC family thiol-disulfide oxidoreductase YuxK